MITFKTFITEASSSSLRDPKGKLFELLVGRSMHPGKYFPSIFRSNNKTPKEVHDELKTKVGPQEYSKLKAGAEKTAHHVLKTLHSAKHPGIEEKEGKYHISKDSSVSWVSNPTDYKKLMDKHGTTDKTTKSNADIVITHHPKGGQVTHHAISLKYSSRIPTESGPGLSRLEGHMGTDKIPLQDISNRSNQEIHTIMGETSRENAKDKFKSLPRDHEQSLKVQRASLRGLQDIAGKYHSGLNTALRKEDSNIHQKRLKKVVSNLSGIGISHDHTHYRVRYNPERDSVKMTDPVKAHKKIMDVVKTIEPVHSGTSVHFHGITDKGNKVHLGTLNVKRRDSPLSNIQGSYKLGKIYH